MFVSGYIYCTYRQNVTDNLRTTHQGQQMGVLISTDEIPVICQAKHTSWDLHLLFNMSS